jgi:hypothetical protein
MKGKLELLLLSFALLAVSLFILSDIINGLGEGELKNLIKFAHNHTDTEVCYRISSYPKWNGLYCIRYKKESTPTKIVECREQ